MASTLIALHFAASFLIARDAQKPVGYINFRFELEGLEVVYW